MPPQQPSTGPRTPTPTPETPSQYEFIMNYGAQPARRPLVAGSNMKARIAIVAGGFCVLLIGVWAFTALLSRPALSNTAALTKIAQQQNELIRISHDPPHTAINQATQNFAETTKLTLMTDQQTVVAFLLKHGVTVDGKTLQATASTATDTSLNDAKTTGSYDRTYMSIAQTQLAAYQHSIEQTYANADSANEKQLLKSMYDHTKLLTQMAGK